MSLQNIIAEKLGLSGWEIERIANADDSYLEVYIDDLKSKTMRQGIGSRSDKLYNYALREAERRLSMAGARERFKRERCE